MGFKIVGAKNGWLIVTENGTGVCFFPEEYDSQDGLRKAMSFINSPTVSQRQFVRLRKL